MKAIGLLAAALAALSLSACVSVKEPIGTSTGYVNDPALRGTWLSVPDDGKAPAYVHVLLNDDATMTVIAVSQGDDKDKASWGELSLTTVRLGSNHYMNVREISEDGKPKDDPAATGSIPLLYAIKGDMLSLFSFDEKKVADAIRAHRIEGTIEKTQFGDSVSITADGPHLDAALAKPDAPALFEPVMTLKRVK